MKKTRIVTRNDRIEAYRENTLIGYAENDHLYAMDTNGFAVPIGEISHRSEIAGKIDAWLKQSK